MVGSMRTRGSRVAAGAMTFVLTLVAYLFVAAIPAMAVSTCSNATDTNILVVSIDTDDTLVLNPDGGVYEFSVNGGAFVACGGTADSSDFEWIQVTGSNAGNETFVMLEPGFVATIDFPNNTTVDLGNGVDTVNVDWGDAPGLPGSDPFVSVPSDTAFGTAAGGVQVAEAFDVTFLRLDQADNVIVTGDSLAAPGITDVLDNANLDGIAASAGTPAATDDIPAAPAGSASNLNTTFVAGSGDDELFSGNGNEVFQGGAGSDAISYQGAASGVTVDLQAGTGTGMGNDTLTDVQEAEGSDNDDTLLGSSLDNNISGLAGDDTIDGREGNDGGTPGFLPLGLQGGDDDDLLAGSAGNDIVNGNDGDDVIDEGAAPNGADDLDGPGDTDCDTIDYSARTGAVTVNDTTETGWGEAAEGDTGSGFEIFMTGSGNDTLVGNGSSEVFVPGAGDDTVEGNGQGAGGSPCGLGALDFLDLSAAAGGVTFDLINGTATGEGNDTFSEMEGYLSGAGDDTLLLGDANANDNTLENWSSDGGIDTVDASAATTNQTITLRLFGFDCSPDLLVGCLEVENATGGSGNDTIQGNGLNNTLIGGDGADDIQGLNGNDTVEGGAGNDSLIGNNGADTLLYVNAPSGEDIDTQLGFASGGDGEDTIQFFEIVKGSDFADTINAGQTAFSLNNRIFGRGGEDNIVGSNSADLLVGGGADDTIRAGKGDDTLKGNAGNDFLVGGGGFDIGFGGKGKDDCKKIEQKHSC